MTLTDIIMYMAIAGGLWTAMVYFLWQKSKNILMALREAKSKHLTCIGMTGNHGGEFKDLCDLTIDIPSSETPHIQEGHLILGHWLCEYIEKTLEENVRTKNMS